MADDRTGLVADVDNAVQISILRKQWMVCTLEVTQSNCGLFLCRLGRPWASSNRWDCSGSVAR